MNLQTEDSNWAKLISYGYLASGLVNILGILFFSVGFTNTDLSDLYPEVFSHFGLLVILLWGLAYISVHRVWYRNKWLAGVFALEKFLYVLSWIYWIGEFHSRLPMIFQKSILTGTFYCIYGISDFLFLVLFAFAFYKADYSERT